MNGLFLGVYRGIVVNNADPEGRLRLQVQVPQVLGEQATDWAWPCLPPGWPGHGHSAAGGTEHTHSGVAAPSVPAPGTGVWVLFEGGDVTHPVWLGTWQGQVA